MQNPSIFKYLYRYAARFPTNQPAKIDKFTPKQTQNDGGQAGNQRPEPYRVVMWWIASVCSRPRGQSPTRRALHRTHKATSDTSPEIALCRGICEHTCASACAVCVCVCVYVPFWLEAADRAAVNRASRSAVVGSRSAPGTV